MAKVFESMAAARLQGHERKVGADPAELVALQSKARASITISGSNGATTRELARTLFPNDPEPQVMEETLGELASTQAAVSR